LILIRPEERIRTVLFPATDVSHILLRLNWISHLADFYKTNSPDWKACNKNIRKKAPGIDHIIVSSGRGFSKPTMAGYYL
jgi:hypothetical protein